MYSSKIGRCRDTKESSLFSSRKIRQGAKPSEESRGYQKRIHGEVMQMITGTKSRCEERMDVSNLAVSYHREAMRTELKRATERWYRSLGGCILQVLKK